MGIVVIHGAGPGSGKPNVLARQWQDALVSGLRAAGLSNAEEQDIRFAYYGDLGRDGRAAANAGPTDLQLAVAHEVLTNGGVDERPKPDRFADLVTRLNNNIGADKGVLTRFLVDVDAYFGNPDIRARTVEAARSACLESSGPTVLLGHGLGSVIAYELLTTDEAEALHVVSLLTFGSPLGMQAFEGRWNGPIRERLSLPAFAAGSTSQPSSTSRPEKANSRSCIGPMTGALSRAS